VEIRERTDSGGTSVHNRSATTQPPPLLVLKGSRVREYLQQNQQLLAAPVGAVTRTRYNQTWVASRVDLHTLTPGRTVIILMSDSPYRVMCPVRHARLVSAKREGSYLDLVLSVEEFVDPEAAGRDCGAALAAAARAARGLHPLLLHAVFAHALQHPHGLQ